MNKNSIKFPKQGATSFTVSMPHIFVKYIIKCMRFHVYEREKHLSTVLSKFDWYPKLLYSDDDNKILIFKNVGIPVTNENKPHDLKKQFSKILTDMKSVNVKHNDIKKGEILVDKNGKIYLCDFGWASINDDLSCGINIWGKGEIKPRGVHNDDNTLERLSLV